MLIILLLVAILLWNFLSNHIKLIIFCKKTIKNNRIIDGGLKSYCKTRWTSMYDLTESVLRLKPYFDIVSYYINICLI